MASQRTTYLFEKAFQLVASSIWKNEGLEGLQRSEVLNLRAVCSYWSVIIEKMIKEKFPEFQEGSTDLKFTLIRDAFSSLVDKRSFNYFDYEDEALDLNSVHHFLRHFEVTHGGNHSIKRNPLIWGEIYMTIYGVDANHERYRKYLLVLEGITTLLSKYGSHLHNFYLLTEDGWCIGNTSLLRKWFLMMPNLTETTLQDDFGNGNRVVEQELISHTPFPNLKLLKTVHSVGIPTLVFDQLMRKNGQVSTLTIGQWKVGYNIFSFPFPNLRRLELGWCSAEIIEQLASPQVQWHLEALRISFYNNPDIGWASLLQVIQDKFANTLVSLDFGYSISDNTATSRIWQTLKNFRLSLPKLRKINIRLGSNRICLDFLLPMKNNLEEISLKTCYKFPLKQNMTATSGTIVQFMGFEEKMLDSNVWVLFKMLKLVSINLNQRLLCYSRDEWLKNNEYL